MQPLKTIVNPSIESVIGCFANGDGSITASRRWPSATAPDDQTPQSSGPRGVRASVIRATATTSAAAPSNRTSPAMPHMTERSGHHAQLAERRIACAFDQHAFAHATLEEVDDDLRDALTGNEHGHTGRVRAHRLRRDLAHGLAQLDPLR